MPHNATPDLITWAPGAQRRTFTATTTDWEHVIIEFDGGAELAVRRRGTRPSALAYKREIYASADNARRAAVRFERTFTHDSGHLRYRADPLKRVRGWYSDPRYSRGIEDTGAA
jgi:hypothetical protein